MKAHSKTARRDLYTLITDTYLKLEQGKITVAEANEIGSGVKKMLNSLHAHLETQKLIHSIKLKK